MKFLLIILATLAFVACGNDDDSGSSSKTEIEGNWSFELDNDCVSLMGFEGDEYDFQQMCIDGSNVYLELEAGTFTIEENVISYVPNWGSCKGLKKGTLRFSVTDTTLSVGQGSKRFLYSKFTPTDGDVSNLAVTTGCFEEDGFVEREPKDL